MPDTHSFWRTDRPAEGFYTTTLAADPGLVVRTFTPDQYEPRYAYPLLILFHGRGGNEDSVLRLVPKTSRRNFVAVSLRGPDDHGLRADGRTAFGWDSADGHDLADYVTRTVEQTRRTYHVHSERIFLVGVNEGATAAYRAAFALGDKVAGVAALNGSVPRPIDGNPVFQFDAVRSLRVLIAHGVANAHVSATTAHRDERLLYACGADVEVKKYPATNRLHPDMLKDLNRWVIGQVNAEHDQLVRVRQ